MTKLEYYQIQDYHKAGISEEEIAKRLNISGVLIHKAIIGKLYKKKCIICDKEFYSTACALSCSLECKRKHDVNRSRKYRKKRKKEESKVCGRFCSTGKTTRTYIRAVASIRNIREDVNENKSRIIQ